MSALTRLHKNLVYGLAAAALVAVSGWFIYQKIMADQGRIDTILVDLRLSKLILSLASLTLSILIGAWVWNKILLVLGHPLPPLRAMYIHLISNFSKYIPGFIWPYFGKLLLARPYPIPVPRVLVSMFLEYLFIGIGGLAWLLVSFPYCRFYPLSPPVEGGFKLGGWVALGVLFYYFPTLVNGLLRFFHGRKSTRWEAFAAIAEGGKLRRLFFCVFLGWGFLAGGFLALVPVPLGSPFPLARLTFAFVASILIGLIIFFVPLGLGVREALLIHLLPVDFSPLFLVEVSLLYRLGFIAGEIISILLILILLKTRKEPITDR